MIYVDKFVKMVSGETAINPVANQVNLAEKKQQVSLKNPTSLPKEIWLKIFKYLGVQDLGRLSSVDHYFNFLSADDSLWKKWILSGPTSQPILQTDNFKHICRILKNHELIQSFNPNEPKTKLLKELIVHIGMYDNFFNDAIVQSMASSSSCLTEFCISTNSPKDFERLSKTSLLNLFKRHPEVKHLKLQGCSSLDGKAFEQIITSCPNLESVHLSSTQLTNDLVAKCTKLKSLKSLTLSGDAKLTDKALEHVSKCKNLTHLDIRIFDDVFSSKVVEKLVTKIKNLESFSMDGFAKWTDQLILQLAQGSPNLSELSLGGCKHLTTKTQTILKTHCPKLIDSIFDE